ncbi:MAG: ABC transporter permease [Gloeobacteraceae cyanobacterium ES-bin-144]|nr:ABC transporter permease [Verrucomicrobiales bacterium]
MPLPPPLRPSAAWHQDGGAIILELVGEWKRGGPDVELLGRTEQWPGSYRVDQLGSYDSTLPAFLFSLIRSVPAGEKPGLEGLPDGLKGLLELALSTPEENGNTKPNHASSEIRKLGKITLRTWASITALADFTGQAVLSLGRFFTGHAHFRRADFWLTLQQCGVQALPIVSLISFLIGLILAFVGNVQLTHFGANLFVADLVGIAMVREMGVMMTAIIMSGRTGAAFAALIGSMKANEEIDALLTFGFNPFDFLVLPRLLALVLMMPLLTIYANIVGILGGMLVGALVGIPPILYWNETLAAVDLTNASLGVIKSVFFGAAIAISGCMQGMCAGNSSAAVGEATTRAVVAAITAVIVLDSAFAALFTVLDI